MPSLDRAQLRRHVTPTEPTPVQSLELKIPPPIVALIAAVAMWGIKLISPVVEISSGMRLTTALALALLGGACAMAGALTFRRAKTTVNPLRPERATSLVSSGIYRLTRNPMYVGVLAILVAWAVFLAAPLALIGPAAFAAYITRFQIRPEERALSVIFGNEYEGYRSRVRRWL